MNAVLFDADGVIQRRPAGWRDQLQSLIGTDRDPDRFLASLFSAEDPALCGGHDFAEALPEVLRRWECRVPLSRVLDVWKMIEVDRDAMRIVRTLRQTGVRCHLATNQEAHRAQHMSEMLGYRELFDREFYSCDLGAAKPSKAFFSAITDSIGEKPERILLIDDRRENVDAAHAAGIQGAVHSLAAGVDGLRKALRDFGIHAT